MLPANQIAGLFAQSVSGAEVFKISRYILVNSNITWSKNQTDEKGKFSKRFFFFLTFCNELVIRTLDYQSMNLALKTTWWLYSRASISSFRVRSDTYHELLGTYSLEINWLLVVSFQPWDSWTLFILMGYKVFCFF